MFELKGAAGLSGCKVEVSDAQVTCDCPRRCTTFQQTLSRSPRTPLSLTNFYTQTAAMLGPPNFAEEQREVYREIVSDLLDDGSRQLRSTTTRRLRTCAIAGQNVQGDMADVPATSFKKGAGCNLV